MLAPFESLRRNGLLHLEDCGELVRDYRQRFQSVLAEPTPAEERRRIAELLEQLRVENDEFERARAGRTPEARIDKRRLRSERRLTLSSIPVSLARVGEIDGVDALQKNARQAPGRGAGRVPATPVGRASFPEMSRRRGLR